jgi:UDP-N-acetylglucosamine:LPS N-acetylglucosamine transferase
MTASALDLNKAGSRKTKILAVASGGGHWVQLLRLRPAFAGEHVTYVTVGKVYRADIGTAPLYVVNDATRWSKWGLLILAVRMFRIILRERPDVVITTGAAPGYFAVMIGKLFGARTAWLDSMANVEQFSLAGRKARRWTDLWLTQWPALAHADGPSCEGSVL